MQQQYHDEQMAARNAAIAETIRAHNLPYQGPTAHQRWNELHPRPSSVGMAPSAVRNSPAEMYQQLSGAGKALYNQIASLSPLQAAQAIGKARDLAPGDSMILNYLVTSPLKKPDATAVAVGRDLQYELTSTKAWNALPFTTRSSISEQIIQHNMNRDELIQTLQSPNAPANLGLTPDQIQAALQAISS